MRFFLLCYLYHPTGNPMSHQTLTLNDMKNSSTLEDLFQFLSKIPEDKRKEYVVAIGTPDGAIPIDNIKANTDASLEGGLYTIGQHNPDSESYSLPFSDGESEYGNLRVFLIGGDM